VGQDGPQSISISSAFLMPSAHVSGWQLVDHVLTMTRDAQAQDLAVSFAPEEQSDGREMAGLVVSSGDLATVRDQRPPLETSIADSVDSTAPSVVRALAQLSGTLIMLAGAGEVGRARVVHEAIGKLLAPPEGSRTAALGINVIALDSARTRERGGSAGPM
jgi:hypothetical protein